VGGPFLDGDLVVLRHPHRQLGGTDPPGQLPERREPTAGLVVEGRDGHQAGHVESEAAERVDQRADVTRRASALLWLVAQVHLHQHPRPGRAAGDLGTEGFAVDRLPQRHPRSERGNLVALELPEEVPPRAGDLGLGAELLLAVLPHVGDARRDDLLDPHRVDGLGRGDERDRGGIATRARRGGSDARANLGHVRRDVGTPVAHHSHHDDGLASGGLSRR
jgi:hypothetical protein